MRHVLRRRRLFTLLFGAGTFLLASGHTPYRQWSVYRKRHLLVLTNKLDAPSFPLGKAVAAVLAEFLPASRARAARAPHLQRIASLLGTHQIDLAILREAEAMDLRNGNGHFEATEAIALQSIAALGEFLLVCREDFAPHHGYMVAETLVEHRDGLSVSVAKHDDASAIPTHAGALAYFAGESLPEDSG